MGKPTISDLAGAAGVSATTVSHAFSGRRHVDPETVERIKKLAREMGYRPNPAAQRLRTGRTGAIALASSMPFAISAGPSRLGFLMEIAASAAIASLSRNLVLCLVPPMEPGAHLDAIAVDGAILVEPSGDDRLLSYFGDRGVPVVSLGKVPGRDDIPFVDLRSRDTALMVLQHLRTAGSRSIGLVTGTQRRNSYVETEAAYQEFAATEGFMPLAFQIDEAGGEDEAERRCIELLVSNPRLDSLFVPVDAFATGAIRAAKALDRTVPESLRLATRYDGLRAKLAVPPLTAVDLHLEELADVAVDLLIARMGGSTSCGPVVPMPDLVLRRSSE